MILTHNGVHRLGAMLPIVIASTGGARILVVDNGSSDSTAALPDRFEGVEVISTGANLSPAAAINRGLALIPAEVPVLRLDDDVIPLPGWLDSARAAASEPSIGVIGGFLYSPDGSVQFAGGTAHRPYSSEDASWSVAASSASETAESCTWVSGACFYMTAAARKAVPRFDEQYPFWFEDVDYCFAARAAGLGVRCERGLALYHMSPGSIVSRPEILVSHKRFVRRWFDFVDLWDADHSLDWTAGDPK